MEHPSGYCLLPDPCYLHNRMRWSIIRLIWLRELRDQLRDRRTVFMIAVLPLVLYPLAGFGVVHLARSLQGRETGVGVAGLDNLLPWRPVPASLPRTLGFLACTPPPPGCPAGLAGRLVGPVALAAAPGPQDHGPGLAVAGLGFTPAPPGCPTAGVERAAVVAALALGQPPRDWPPLVETREGGTVFRHCFLRDPPGRVTLLLPVALPETTDPDLLPDLVDRTLLDGRKVDVILVVPPGFQQWLATTGQGDIYLLSRRDDTSRLVRARISAVLGRWKQELKQVRLARQGLPVDFDEPLRIRDPYGDEQVGPQSPQGLFPLMTRIFPFILVMWSLAGALYPAVDLCAGEKERGTMETLLISPAGREEIVWGKFLTIWVFSAATALLNLVSMAVTTWWQFAAVVPGVGFSPAALFWGVLLLLPLSAFFSAVCLAVGAYARSSKEGQYYLMPLFLVTMPLVFLTLAPGVELNPFYSMVPVTGVALLLQRLMSAPSSSGVFLYFVPVLAPMVIYSWLALRWAIAQFQREEVLFREAERLDLALWVKRLLREKEALPTTGEAIFCFVLILALRWFSLGVAARWPVLPSTGVAQLAFVATPPLFMALVLTSRPLAGLGLRRPPWWSWPAAVLLALAVVPPLVELVLAVARREPTLKTLLELNQPLMSQLQQVASTSPWLYFLVVAVLPALCEELAFRGFILAGLLRAFRPRTAILLSAFLFAVYQMNVFQFAPHFLLGVVLGLLAWRAGSVLPAMLFHLLYNALILAPFLLKLDMTEARREPGAGRLALAAGCVVLVGAGLLLVWYLGRRRAEGRVS
jgi:sodium transport system permease protein